MRAIKIDPKENSIGEIDVKSLKDIQKAVGGLICFAHQFENGDCLFVDDEGLFKDNRYIIFVASADQPFAGNGVILGAADQDGNNTPAKSTLEFVAHEVSTGEAIP